MTTSAGKMPINRALKIAILDSGRTQRQISLETSTGRCPIGEVRLSAIVNGHGKPATDAEKAEIARVLDRRADDLFPAVAA